MTGGVKAVKTSSKGVRFADLVENEERETASADGVEAGSKMVTVTKQDEDGSVDERERLEMDSVDFDKVTGTSTPITEESPRLTAKHTTSSTANDSSTTADEGEYIIKEGVAENEHTSSSHQDDNSTVQHSS